VFLQYVSQPNLPADSSVDSKDFAATDLVQRAPPQQPEMVCPNAYRAKHWKPEVGWSTARIRTTPVCHLSVTPTIRYSAVP